jgi:hypothetical protein
MRLAKAIVGSCGPLLDGRDRELGALNAAAAVDSDANGGTEKPLTGQLFLRVGICNLRASFDVKKMLLFQ